MHREDLSHQHNKKFVLLICKMNFGKLLAKLNNIARSQLRQFKELKKRLITITWLKYFL